MSSSNSLCCFSTTEGSLRRPEALGGTPCGMPLRAELSRCDDPQDHMAGCDGCHGYRGGKGEIVLSF